MKNLLKQVNVLQDYCETYFYVTLNTNPIQYGVAVNIKDKDNMQEIIDKMILDRKEQIEGWNEEQYLRNLNEGGVI